MVDFTQYPDGRKGAGPGYVEPMDKLVNSLAGVLAGSAIGAVAGRP